MLDNEHKEMITLLTSGWNRRPPAPFDESKMVPLEVKAGSLVVLHGQLVHMSYENK